MLWTEQKLSNAILISIVRKLVKTKMDEFKIKIKTAKFIFKVYDAFKGN